MASQPGTGFFTLKPRRKPTVFPVQAKLQLGLPIAIVLLTTAFLGLLALHARDIFGRVFAFALEEVTQPEYFLEMLAELRGDFLLVWAMLAIGYAVTVFTLCIVHAHRMIGPTVAFRRHLEALKNGDTTSRVTLRDGDAFGELADDLNELAALLGEERKADAEPVDEEATFPVPRDP